MKPLSEFAEGLVESQDFYETAYVYRHAPSTDQALVVERFEELKAHIKRELQAWLREAEEWVERQEDGYIHWCDVRDGLLGTTEGK